MGIQYINELFPIQKIPPSVYNITSSFSENFQFSVNAFIGLLDATILSCDPYYIEKINKDLPVLFVSGGGDLVGNFGEGVRKVYNMYKEAGIKDVTIKIYENGRHEVLN